MPSLNFKKQFQQAILTGAKEQTIRATRKKPIKVGDSLHLFTGMRTSGCLALGVHRCVRVRDIAIYTSGCSGIVKLEGKELTAAQVDALAKDDGFPNAGAFLDFFADNHGPNFEGQLIEWRN
jgi:hypothetical protein